MAKKNLDAVFEEIARDHQPPLRFELLRYLPEIEALRHQGVKIIEIADRMGIDRHRFTAALTSARKYAERHGLPPFDPPQPSALSYEEIAEIRAEIQRHVARETMLCFSAWLKCWSEQIDGAMREPEEYEYNGREEADA